MLRQDSRYLISFSTSCENRKYTLSQILSSLQFLHRFLQLSLPTAKKYKSGLFLSAKAAAFKKV
jgi:hypothetical protein